MSRTITFRPGRTLASKLPKEGASAVIRAALEAYFARQGRVAMRVSIARLYGRLTARKRTKLAKFIGRKHHV